MTGGGKRKDAPTGAAQQSGGKKKKTGNAGKWKTPQHQAKQLDSLRPGDKGIWVTCARHKEDRASREISLLFSEYAQKLYGIKDEADPGSDESDGDDIEAAVQREVAALKAKEKNKDGNRLFTPMKMNVDCLLFFKTREPIEPIEFVRRICADAKNSTDPSQLKCRYVNRLTPVTVMGKASESGLLEVARKALAPYFKITGAEPAANMDDKVTKSTTSDPVEPVGRQDAKEREFQPSTFAIRPTIRNHSTLKRDWVIQQTAALVDQELHKVNLKTPDQVILIDIYQTVCGMSVVGSDWEDLKRYNLTEIYGPSARPSKDAKDSED